MNTVYYDYETKNTSFLEMSNYLKSIGVKNNNFMLAIYNKDLIGIDPYDSNLTFLQKIDIIRECVVNIWYFLRNIAKEYNFTRKMHYWFELDKVNCAQIFLLMNNIDTWVSKHRQSRKSVDSSVICNWFQIFNNTYENIYLIGKDKNISEMMINRMNHLKIILPDYIKNFSAAKNIMLIPVVKAKSLDTANQIGRSLSGGILFHFEDAEYIKYITKIYSSMYPLYNKNKQKAIQEEKHCGILFESVYSDDPEIEELINSFIPFDETMYDMSTGELQYMMENQSSPQIIHIQYSYQELGYTEEWFNELCNVLNNDKDVIRREILLQRKPKEEKE